MNGLEMKCLHLANRASTLRFSNKSFRFTNISVFTSNNQYLIENPSVHFKSEFIFFFLIILHRLYISLLF